MDGGDPARREDSSKAFFSPCIKGRGRNIFERTYTFGAGVCGVCGVGVCRATKVEWKEAETQLVDSFDLREARECTGAARV